MLHIPALNTTIELDDKANIVCAIDEELVVTSRKVKKNLAKKPRPSWTSIGDGMQTRHFKSYPYEQTLLKLNANEAKFFSLTLKNYNSRTGYAIIDLSECTPSEKSKHSLGYKGLKQRELIKRVRPQTYLINPTAKIHLSLFDELWQVWNNTP